MSDARDAAAQLTADNAAQQGQLVRLDGLIGAKLSEMATTIRIRAGGLEAASRIVRSDVGIRDDGRHPRAARVMRDEEDRLYAARDIRWTGPRAGPPR